MDLWAIKRSSSIKISASVDNPDSYRDAPETTTPYLPIVRGKPKKTRVYLNLFVRIDKKINFARVNK